MKWSQLKKRLESNLCTRAQGRVELWQTLYHKCPNQEGEFWITFDKKKIFGAGSCSFLWKLNERTQEIKLAGSSPSDAWDEAYQELEDKDHFLLEQINKHLFQSLNLSIQELFTHPNSVVRALAYLDKRCGLRRLKKVASDDPSPLVQEFIRLRFTLEKLPLK